MTTLETLWQQVLEHPDDNDPRLILADCLRESFDPADVLYGRWIWAGVKAYEHRERLHAEPEYVAAMNEMREVQPEFMSRYMRSIGFSGEFQGVDHICDSVTLKMVGSRRAVFARGLLSFLALPLDGWQAAAQDVFRVCPLETVEITDVPGLTFKIRRLPNQEEYTYEVYRWIITGEVTVDRYKWNHTCGAEPRGHMVEIIAEQVEEIVERLRNSVGDRWPQQRPVRTGVVRPAVMPTQQQIAEEAQRPPLVPVTRPGRCEECGGMGSVANFTDRPYEVTRMSICRSCGGSGDNGTACPACYGTGGGAGYGCSACGGTGGTGRIR